MESPSCLADEVPEGKPGCSPCRKARIECQTPGHGVDAEKHRVRDSPSAQCYPVRHRVGSVYERDCRQYLTESLRGRGQPVECLEAKKPVPTQRSKGEPVTSTIVHSQKLDLPTAGREVGLDRKGA